MRRRGPTVHTQDFLICANPMVIGFLKFLFNWLPIRNSRNRSWTASLSLYNSIRYFELSRGAVFPMSNMIDYTKTLLPGKTYYWCVVGRYTSGHIFKMRGIYSYMDSVYYFIVLSEHLNSVNYE